MYGQGVGCLGPDCADDNRARNPGREDICNGIDDDCDTDFDDSPSNCAAPRCEQAVTGRYIATGMQMCTVGSCGSATTTPCGLYTCDGRGGAGTNCATRCNPAGSDDDGYCVQGARCIGGACVEIRCGDGFIDPPEGCDDGNTANGDGCSSDCRNVECSGLGTVTFVDMRTNHCYWRSTDVVTSRDAAASQCTARRGHLIYLETVAERDFAFTGIGFSGTSRAYIGLRAGSVAQYGTFRGQWENGMNLTYAFFRSGEPSGDGPCTEWGPQNSGNDIPCGTDRDYICEREPPGTRR